MPEPGCRWVFWGALNREFYVGGGRGGKGGGWRGGDGEAAWFGDG